MSKFSRAVKFGINHDTDFLAMNPNGLVPLLRDDESDLILWESNAIVRYLAAQYGQKRLWIDSTGTSCGSRKWMDWANQTLSNAHRGILMGLVRTPPEERDQAAIDASCKECDALFALLDAELAKVKNGSQATSLVWAISLSHRSSTICLTLA